ncbi:MAG TPA: DUF362 domain-containing protein [Syntrophales bacterium]|nr:DUF362 domain-containing protein [Syntrophales bacterium]HOL60063.1 DUF362 domain-containing protein [Syntrophales bacterium]HPO36173.1 DUF362 domain-containing protein [Syntrophales bacterium]
MKVIVRTSAYNYEKLRSDVYDLIKALLPFTLSGRSVLIKPNLLLPATHEQAVCTHPLVVRAVVEYVLNQGGYPWVGDSPAMGSFARVIKVAGLEEALQDLPVSFRPFESSVPVDCGPPFGVIELSREAVEADLMINVPKFKTHSQMLLTLGVKNLFGCVVGLRKVKWHLQVGVDRDLFAQLLLSIAQRLSPAVTILDGILALEGEGPGKRGNPKPVGVLIGADDPLGVDMAVCRLLGLDPDTVPVLAAAKNRGLLPSWEALPRIEGKVVGFRLPHLEPLLATAGPLKGVLRKYFLARPVPDMKLCRLCGECVKMCPAQAIESVGRLSISYDRCIRCYCCIEICPYGAMMKKEGNMAKALGFILQRTW